MIQIRQKKNIFRNQIRRQYLNNHFRQIRKRFNTVKETDGSQSAQIKILNFYLKQSLIKNCMLQYIKTHSVQKVFGQYFQKACSEDNNTIKKYLFAIISNILNDDINQEFQIVQQLFRITIDLFKSLGISEFDLSNKATKAKFDKIVEEITINTLFHYFSSLFRVQKNLQMQHQLQIQNCIYPALFLSAFFVLEHEQNFDNIIEFEQDFKASIMSIFDPNQSQYNSYNYQKAKRILNLLKNVIEHHLYLVNKKNIFPKKAIFFQQILFWFYNKLTDYYTQLKQLFQSKSFFILLQNKYGRLIIEESQHKFKGNKCILLLLRTLIDKQVFIKQINQLLSNQHEQCNNKKNGFQFLLQTIQKRQSCWFQSFELLSGLLVSYHYNNNFKFLFEKNKFRIAQICLRIIYNFDRNIMSLPNQLEIFQKTLQMVYALNIKQNKKQQMKINEFILYFQNLGAIDRLHQNYIWLSSILKQQNYIKDSRIQRICQFVQAIIETSLQLEQLTQTNKIQQC